MLSHRSSGLFHLLFALLVCMLCTVVPAQKLQPIPASPVLLSAPPMLPFCGTTPWVMQSLLLGTPGSSYDLRAQGKLSPVSTQSSLNVGWAFATMTSLESGLLPGEMNDFSEENLLRCHGFDLGPNAGGNIFMSAAYLTRWGGPVNEADDPFDGSSPAAGTLPPRKHVQEVVMLPWRNNALDNDGIKQALMDYGAVQISMHWEDEWFNNATNAYYYTGTAMRNYDVAIVGWDDYYSREHFLTQPAGDGAFIARNSKAGGYFYLSYYDTKAARETFNAVFPNAEATSNYTNIYQYDPYGWVNPFGYDPVNFQGSPSIWASNVFTAQGAEMLKAVGFYTTAQTATVEVRIYLNPAASPTSGTLALTMTDIPLSFMGYHTVPLATPVALAAGQRFSVVLKILNTDANSWYYGNPLAIENPSANYSSQARASAGQSFFSANGSAWLDLTSSIANTNACIKAYSAGDAAPTAVNDSYAAVQEAQLAINAANGVLVNDSDPDAGDTLVAELVSGPVNAANFTLNSDGSFTYTGKDGFSGDDTFTYKAKDPSGVGSNVATVTLHVSHVNHAPVANDDSYNTTQETALSVTAADGVLKNDTNADVGDTRIVQLVTSPSNALNFSLNNDGSFSYTGKIDYFGDDTFTYKARDAAGLYSNIATVTIHVAHLNHAPEAIIDSFDVMQARTLTVAAVNGVLSNDIDSDADDTLIAVLVTAPGNAASFTLNSDGSFSYIGTHDFFGNDTFTYKAKDAAGAYSNVVTVTLRVAMNHAPVSVNDQYSVRQERALTVNAANGVLHNDYDNDADDTLTVELVDAPLNAGHFILQNNGAFTYTGKEGFYGDDTFTYKVKDIIGTYSNVATVTIHVLMNQAPVAIPDSYSIMQERTLTVNTADGVLSNDTDADAGDTRTVELVDAPEHAATFLLSSEGSFVYAGNIGFVGDDTFTYKAKDALGAYSNVVTVTIHVEMNHPPVAIDDSYDAEQGGLLYVSAEQSMLVNDTDPDFGDTKIAEIVTNPGHSAYFWFFGDGFYYWSAPDFTGDDSFTYRVMDGFGAYSNVATVTIHVKKVNHAPMAMGDQYSLDQDSSLTVQAPGVLWNDHDWDGDAIKAILTDTVQHGTLTFSETGAFTYTPEPGFTGMDSCMYMASDGTLTSAHMMCSFWVNACPAVTAFTPTNGCPGTRVTLTGRLFTGVTQVLFNGAPSHYFTIDSDTQITAVVPYGVTTGPISITTPQGSYHSAQDFNAGNWVEKIAFVSDRDGNNEIYLMNTDGTGIQRVTDNPGDDRDPAFSPDGRRIAFVSNRDGNWEIYVMNADGSGLTRLTNNVVADQTPAFSPDGRQIVYVSELEPMPRHPSIYVMNADGSGQTRLTDPVMGDFTPAFSPDGRHIVYASLQSGIHNIMIMNSDGSGTTQLTDTEYSAGSPAFSPDGRQIVYRASVNYSAQIFIMNADGSGQTCLTNSGRIYGEPVFSPDGSIILYDSCEGLIVMNTDGSNPTHLPGTSGHDSMPAWGVRANLAPAAASENYDAVAETLLAVDAPGVLANDTDADGDALTAELVESPGHASSFILNSDGSFSYQAEPHYTGNDTFTYRVKDINGVYSNTVQVTIAVTSENHAPTALADSYTTSQEQVLVVTTINGVLQNDADADANDTLTAELVAGPAHAASFTLNGDGSFSYTGKDGFVGDDAFTYKAKDTAGAYSAVVTVTIHVTHVNHAPVANNDSYQSMQEGSIIITSAAGVLANDTDTDDGDAMTAELVDSPGHARFFTLRSDGSFTYTGENGFFGDETFTYKAKDTAGVSSNLATVTIHVTHWNHQAAALADSYTTMQGHLMTVTTDNGVLHNDSDADVGDTLTAEVVASPGHATAFTLNSDGSFSYQGELAFFGNDTFTYKAKDAAGLYSNVATVTIHVTMSHAPVAVDDSYQALQEGSIVVLSARGVLANDTDAVDAMTAELVDPPGHGRFFTLRSDGSFTYTGEYGFFGDDTFTYTARDAAGDTSNLATVTIHVAHVNHQAAAHADSYTTVQGLLLTVNANNGVLANDTDADVGDSLTAEVVTAPGHATAFTLNSDGSFSYQGEPTFSGNDTFTYKAKDAAGLYSNIVLVTIHVTMNHRPVAVADSYEAEQGSLLHAPSEDGVLANDTDADGDVLTAELVSGPGHASSFSLNSDGSFSYQGQPQFIGDDSFTYKVKDCNGVYSNTVTVTITVAHVNHAPTAQADSYTIAQEQVLAVNPIDGVLQNDADADANDTLTAELVAGPAHSASFTLNSNGSFTYIGKGGFFGDDAFTYKAKDAAGASSNLATVTIHVAMNHPPVAVADSYETEQGSLLFAPAKDGVLANDTDAEGDALTAELVSGPGHASNFTLNSDGSFSYQGEPQFIGNDSFTYTSRDINGVYSNVVTVTITVASVNVPPTLTLHGGGLRILSTAGPQTYPGWAEISVGPANENTQTADFLVTTDNDTLFTTAPAISASGTLTFTPKSTTTGHATVTVRAHDNGGGADTSAPQTFNIDVCLPLFDVTLAADPTNTPVAGHNLRFIATPTNGAVPEYAFSITLRDAREDGTSGTQVIVPMPASYTPVNFISFAATDPGVYTVTVTVREHGTTLPKFIRSLKYTVTSPAIAGVLDITTSLSSGVSLSGIPAPPEGITLTATVDGSGADVRYKFTGSLKDVDQTGVITNPAITLDSAFHTGNTCLWHPTQPGTYTLMVTAADSTFNTSCKKSITFVVTSASLTGITSFLATNATSGIDLGHLPLGGIHLVATPTVPAGGTATGIQYKYTGTRRITTDGGVSYTKQPVTLQPDWRTNNSYNWTPQDPGTYTLTVTATDPSFNVSYTKSLTFTVASASIWGIASLTADQPSGIGLSEIPTVGIRLSANLTGFGSGVGVQYKFSSTLKQWNPATGSVISVARPIDGAFHGENSTLWQPQDPGSYTLTVTACDASFSTAYTKTLTFFVQSSDLLGLTLTTDPASGTTPPPGTVTLTATPTMGTGGDPSRNWYKFTATRKQWDATHSSNSTQTVVLANADYQQGRNVYSWHPSTPGVYTLTVSAYDVTHNTTCTKSLSYIVLASDLTGVSLAANPASDANPPPGTVLLTATPTAWNGADTSGVQYKFTGTRKQYDVMHTSTTTVLEPMDTVFHTGNTYTWSPSTPGTYTLTVTAMDASYNTLYTKALTYTVLPADLIGLAGLTTSLASGSRVDQVGDGITLTATTTTAPGGSLENNWYQFTGTLKQWNPTTNSYANVPVTLDTAFHHGNTFVWSPTTPGTYTLTVTAMDASYNALQMKTIQYTLNSPSLVGIFSVAASPVSNTKTLAQVRTTGVHFTVTLRPPSSGDGVQYTYQLTRPGGIIDPVSALTSDNYYDLTAASLTASGTYKLTVIAYDATHNTSFTNTATYGVKP